MKKTVLACIGMLTVFFAAYASGGGAVSSNNGAVSANSGALIEDTAPV